MPRPVARANTGHGSSDISEPKPLIDLKNLLS